jgi:hypothetical protein
MARLADVTVYVDAAQDLTHPSWLYAGLARLADAGEIGLRFRRLAATTLPQLAPGNVFAQTEVVKGGRAFRVLFDFKDQSDIFCDELLPLVDFYFKRSFSSAAIAKLSFCKKIMPLGMPFACRHRRELAPIFGDFLLGRRGQPWRQRSYRFYQYARIARSEAFVASEPSAKLQRVIFQTRLWEPHEVAHERLEAINEPRVSLIRRLQKELGPRFLGGLVPTTRARRDHPDLVRDEGVRRNAYLALMRRSAIGISTRGLFGSTPWKLSEYLSTGIAVVSQPLSNQPLDPLIEGEHLFTFDNESDCVGHCVRLLEHPDEAARLQRAARAYYEQAIDPMSAVRRCLQKVMN